MSPVNDAEKSAATAEHVDAGTPARASPSAPSAAPSDAQPLLVTFKPGDRADPHQWPAWKRYGVVAFASWINVLVCIGASGYSTGAAGIQASFHVSAELVTLGLSLYVVRAPSGAGDGAQGRCSSDSRLGRWCSRRSASSTGESRWYMCRRLVILHV
jgi:hypothetical protein